MKDKILITGGAGFIGSRLARKLLGAGYGVSILDNFSPQIHGGNRDLPEDLRGHAELFRGDVRDVSLCERALKGSQVLVHLAAETGTGQSMYQVRHYTDVNIGATASLMEIMLAGNTRVRSVVVASSRSIYGEGAAKCSEHGTVYPEMRSSAAMQKGDFEPKCPICGAATSMVSTPENAPFHPSSLYGLTKQVQEQMVLMYATTLGINGFGLRYQNVFGPGQSLKNPYTGILAIFSNQARADKPIYVFEDGLESRDFVYVDDVVEATFRAVEAPPQKPAALNVGTGVATTVSELVEQVIAFFSSKSEVTVTGAFREGDIRHSCADTTQLERVLHYKPTWTFEAGMREFLGWAESQALEASNYERSLDELRSKGLMHG
ncbi:NAD-dependent epimerase/dehydratase family protein [Granulicella sp. 5B5]|uniref:NAD-dependent epimerase/dehydratase family protein n=1 Tax=Granulicella sp. 5B5 TaxID=1617967 RepID=UPI0015F50C6E|nr:NAD-dependent epimerase/dehydratase family protein [Granulicella sp. 5B5]QMV19114.1 NAD-dependent epimerase/dehydratase family protein [Granulicella sp. 5B5]